MICTCQVEPEPEGWAVRMVVIGGAMARPELADPVRALVATRGDVDPTAADVRAEGQGISPTTRETTNTTARTTAVTGTQLPL